MGAALGVPLAKRRDGFPTLKSGESPFMFNVPAVLQDLSLKASCFRSKVLGDHDFKNLSWRIIILVTLPSLKVSQKAIPLIDFFSHPPRNLWQLRDQARTAASFMRGNESPVVMRNITGGKKTELMSEEWWNTFKNNGLVGDWRVGSLLFYIYPGSPKTKLCPLVVGNPLFVSS